MTRKTLVLFQQDLRRYDNPALFYAALRGEVIPIYIKDDDLPPPVQMGGASRWWLHYSLRALQDDFSTHGVSFILRRGVLVSVVQQLIAETGATVVYWNRRYEPHAIAALTALKSTLAQQGIEAQSFNASLLVEPWEIKNQQGGYFKVFTPFWNHCLRKIGAVQVLEAPTLVRSSLSIPSESLDSWKLLSTTPDWAEGLRATWTPGEKGAQARLAAFVERRLPKYAALRDVPSEAITSGLSPHLHWGEISPRQIYQAVRHVELSEGHGQAVVKFLAEIGWREFSYYLLYHFPVLPTQPFNSKFQLFPWQRDEALLRAWQRGQTGYPIVDAGMRELWRTGVMHNRVRMVVASFLTKHLRINWQEGAAWFWDTLVDADLASNSASWQWVAGCGADAAPYFRIFNPVLQGQKFDAQGCYVRQWVPELASLPDAYIHAPWEAPEAVLKGAGVTLGKTYPKPIVEHSAARNLAMMAYQSVKGDR